MGVFVRTIYMSISVVRAVLELMKQNTDRTNMI